MVTDSDVLIILLETVCTARIVYREEYGSQSAEAVNSTLKLKWERWLTVTTSTEQNGCCHIEESGIKKLPDVTVLLPKGGKDMEFKSVGMSVAAGVTLGDVNYMAVPLVLHTGSSRRVILVSFRGTATYVPVSP